MEKVLYLKTVSKNHFWIDLIAQWEKKYNWVPSVIAGDNENYEDFIKREFLKIELYNHSEAIRGANPSFLSSKYVFGEKELNFISKYENDFISMINRWSINSIKVDYFILRNYFINMVGIWLEILIQRNITLVILPSIPHRLYDFACYVACQVLKVPYLMIERTGEIRKKNNSYVISGFVVDDLSNRTEKLYNQYLTEKVNINDSDYELIDHLNKDYSSGMPNYFSEKEEKSKQKKTFKSIINTIFLTLKKSIVFLILGFKKSQSIFKFTIQNKTNEVPRIALKIEVFIIGLFNKIRVHWAIKYYKKNVSKPSFEDNYVYLAPHFRPERSTIPDAGYFHDIELIIDLIYNNIPSHWKIFYKEHKSNFRKPIQWNNVLTSKSYMRIKNKYQNLYFIDQDENPFKLIDNSAFVVTATGTTGWESILRGKPAFIFGDAWYRHFPGVFYVKNNKDIKEAIMMINNGFEISSLKIASYAKFLIANSTEVFEFARYEDTEKLKIENNSEYQRLINEYCHHFAQKFQSLSE